MKQPDPLKHKIISLMKSLVRIGGCVIAMALYTRPSTAILNLAFCLLVAEIVGIVEELV